METTGTIKCFTWVGDHGYSYWVRWST